MSPLFPISVKQLLSLEIFGNRIAPWNEETTETIKDYGIDFSAIYGAVGADFNGLLAYVGATDALPIWVKPKIEMNDIRHEDNKNITIVGSYEVEKQLDTYFLASNSNQK